MTSNARTELAVERRPKRATSAGVFLKEVPHFTLRDPDRRLTSIRPE
jgi:hypothetical protein